MADDVLPSDGQGDKPESRARCETCRYGEPCAVTTRAAEPGTTLTDFNAITCRRFPSPVIVAPTDWCGEYAPGVRGGPRG